MATHATPNGQYEVQTLDLHDAFVATHNYATVVRRNQPYSIHGTPRNYPLQGHNPDGLAYSFAGHDGSIMLDPQQHPHIYEAAIEAGVPGVIRGATVAREDNPATTYKAKHSLKENTKVYFTRFKKNRAGQIRPQTSDWQGLSECPHASAMAAAQNARVLQTPEAFSPLKTVVCWTCLQNYGTLPTSTLF